MDWKGDRQAFLRATANLKHDPLEDQLRNRYTISIFLSDVLSGRKENNCIHVDFAIQYDTRIDQKEKEKVDKYQDLKREYSKKYGI